MRRTGKRSSYDLAAIGIMTAVAFVTNFISIPIGDVSRIHLGNPFCALAGILLGPVSGGLAGGLGAFFYDFTNPLYAAEAPITLFNKFFIGYLAGVFAHRAGHHGDKFSLNLIGSIVGNIVYALLYYVKSFIQEYFFMHLTLEAIGAKMMVRLATSAVNVPLAVVTSMVLAPIFLKAMKQAGIYQKLYPSTPEYVAES